MLSTAKIDESVANPGEIFETKQQLSELGWSASKGSDPNELVWPPQGTL